MEWMLMLYRRYFDFEGRSRRREYWMFVLFGLIVYIVLGFLMVAGGLDFSSSRANAGPIFWLGAGLLFLFWLGSIIPAIAVMVRRFHDQDKSGWFVLINFVPYVGPLIVFVFMLLEGTRGPNRFGSDPKEGEVRGV